MIENHVVSLELSQRLKELWVKQESVFAYEMCTHCLDKGCVDVKEWDITTDTEPYSNMTKYSAYLASELSDILPRTVNNYEDLWEQFFCEWYSIGYSVRGAIGSPIIERDKKEPDARALLLIHLIENDLVDEEWRERWLK